MESRIITRRNFLRKGGELLARMALVGGVYVPEAYAGAKKGETQNPQVQNESGNQNQPYVVPDYLAIKPAEFPITANLYPGAVSPGVQHSNPRLASKIELLKVTPSYRKLEEEKCGPARADIFQVQAAGEFFNELYNYCVANGIDFVGDKEAYMLLLTSRPEFASIPEARRNGELSTFLALYDITPALSQILKKKRYSGPASMGHQLSETLR